MSRVIVDDVAVERNLDRRESAVVSGGRNFSLRLSSPAYPYSYPYGCEPDYGYSNYGYSNYGYDPGYYHQSPQIYFGYGDFGGRRHNHSYHDHHDHGRRGRRGGHHGHH